MDAMLPLDVDEGHRTLISTLVALREQAGSPSVREISRLANGTAAPASIARLFNGTGFPRWTLVEAIVRALDGDVTTFRCLYDRARPLRGQASPIAASDLGVEHIGAHFQYEDERGDTRLAGVITQVIRRGETVWLWPAHGRPRTLKATDVLTVVGKRNT